MFLISCNIFMMSGYCESHQNYNWYNLFKVRLFVFAYIGTEKKYLLLQINSSNTNSIIVLGHKKTNKQTKRKEKKNVVANFHHHLNIFLVLFHFNVGSLLFFKLHQIIKKIIENNKKFYCCLKFSYIIVLHTKNMQLIIVKNNIFPLGLYLLNHFLTSC